MGQFQRKYDDEQRAAVEHAWYDRNIHSPARIVALAAAGELTLDGELVAAFAIPPATARSMGERYERRRQAAHAKAVGRQAAGLAERLRMVVDEQLTDIESRQRRRKHATVKAAEITALARAVRELDALETAKPPPVTKGRGEAGKRSDGTPAGGIADKLRAAMAPTADVYTPPNDTTPAQEGEPSPQKGNTDQGAGTEAGETDDGQKDDVYTGDPGSYARDQIAGLRARRVVVG